jgi:hypothetical protein
MADPVKKVIRKIRHKFKPPEKPEHPLVKIIAEHRAKIYRNGFWERDKKTKRAANFQLAQIAREKQVEAIRAEKERQEQIAEQRLENLKKARRKLRRMRKKELEDG